MSLYERIETGQRVSYKPYQPEIDDRELTDGQVATLVSALGVTMIENYLRNVPEHKRLARKVKAVEAAIIDLFQGTGQQIDDEICTYVMDCWNLAMVNMSKGAKP